MKLTEIPKKINDMMTSLRKDYTKIEKIDVYDLAMISLLTRFVIEMENISKKGYHWNSLHSYLHFESTNNSKRSIIKSIIYFLGKSKEDFSNSIVGLASYIDEFSDDYWSFKKIDNNFRKYSNITITSIKLINPFKNIFGIKASYRVPKNVNEIYFFSNVKLEKNKVYNLDLSTYKNDLDHRRLFLNGNNNFTDISKYKEYSKNKLLIEKIKSVFFKTYPINCISYKDIEKYENKYFFYIESDILISSSPAKDIPFFEKVRISKEKGRYDFEYEKLKLINTIRDAKLPFIKESKITLNDKYKPDYGSPYSPRRIGNFVTNEFTLKYIEVLKNIFTSYNKINTPLFLNKNYNKTLFFRPAGHGKSHEIKEFIKSNKNHKYIIFTPTKKAEEIFKEVKKMENVSTYQMKKLVHDFKKKGLKIKLEKGFDKDCIIFFDEISMYDKEMWEIISELNDFKQLNFIGDPWQIPPIYENGWSHLIKHIAHKIIQPHLDLFSKNWRINEQGNNFQKIDLLLKHIRNGQININRESYKTLFTSYDGFFELFKVIENKKYLDYTIISPENYGTIGVNNLSRIIKGKNEEHFSEGDEVVFNKDKKGEFYIGKKVKIIDVLKNENEHIYRFKGSTNEIKVSMASIPPFTLSRALTCHRAQGQSIKKALIVLNESKIIDFRWLYTAISRGIDDVHIFYPIDFNFKNLKSCKDLNNDEIKNLNEFIEKYNEIYNDLMKLVIL